MSASDSEVAPGASVLHELATILASNGLGFTHDAMELEFFDKVGELILDYCIPAADEDTGDASVSTTLESDGDCSNSSDDESYSPPKKKK